MGHLSNSYSALPQLSRPVCGVPQRSCAGGEVGHTGLPAPSDATPVATTGVVPPRALADALRAVACGPGYVYGPLRRGPIRRVACVAHPTLVMAYSGVKFNAARAVLLRRESSSLWREALSAELEAAALALRGRSALPGLPDRDTTMPDVPRPWLHEGSPSLTGDTRGCPPSR
jgi:hypothetical protein